MSFSKITQFESGNFNEWDNLAKAFFLKVNRCVRQILLPTLDKTLDSMLGTTSDGTKTSINVEQYQGDGGILDGVKITVVYTVDDFHVESAPKDAIEKDVESIKNVLINAGLKVESLTINTSNGETTVVIDIPVKDVVNKSNTVNHD